MLLLEAVEAIQPVVERAGLTGDLADAVLHLKYKSRGVISNHIRFTWSKGDALAVNLVMDALGALAEAHEALVNERVAQLGNYRKQ
jgi:hypothetical protein